MSTFVPSCRRCKRPMPSFLFLRPISSCLPISPRSSISLCTPSRTCDTTSTKPAALSSQSLRWRSDGRTQRTAAAMAAMAAARGTLSSRQRPHGTIPLSVLAHPPRQADTKDKRWKMSPTLTRFSCFFPLVPWKALESTRLAPEAGPNICIFGPIPTLSCSNCLSPLGEERAPMQKTADACMKRGARIKEAQREGRRGKKKRRRSRGIGRKKGASTMMNDPSREAPSLSSFLEGRFNKNLSHAHRHNTGSS